MKTRTELAESFMRGLLARDPLPAQRFTEIEVRLVRLAHLAQRCAVIFLAVDAEWEQSPEEAAAVAKRVWDYVASSVPQVPVPKNSQGAPAAKEPDLFGRNTPR